jgi:hypothetical protein
MLINKEKNSKKVLILNLCIMNKHYLSVQNLLYMYMCTHAYSQKENVKKTGKWPHINIFCPLSNEWIQHQKAMSNC